MEKSVDEELFWLISFINDLCDEANLKHPSDTKKYLDKIKDLCMIADRKFILKDGKVIRA